MSSEYWIFVSRKDPNTTLIEKSLEYASAHKCSCSMEVSLPTNHCVSLFLLNSTALQIHGFGFKKFHTSFR